MFWQSPSSFSPTFLPENHFESEEEVDCYKARTQALRQRFPWSTALIPVWNATLVHMSANVPGKVAYFQTVSNMMTNRLTRTSPEMFLQRVLKYAPPEIQTAWAHEVLGQVLPEVKFVHNDDPEGWYDVYNDGPGSCMKGSDYVRQYANPNNHLALAYTTDKHGWISHRTIVNTQKMTYVRIYSREDAAFFSAALNKLGYKASNDTLKDEIIDARWTECTGCNEMMLVGPYLDGSYSRVKLNRKDDTLLIGENGPELCFSEEPYCGNCDDEYSEDEEY